MGEWVPVICLNCKLLCYVQRDRLDRFSVKHRRHDWLIIPQEAIGDWETFKKAIMLILEWDRIEDTDP